MNKFAFIVSLVLLACGAGLTQAQAPGGAILHLDAGDVVDPNDWPDKSLGNDAHRNPDFGPGMPTLASFAFPAGIRPVVRFNADAGYRIDNEDDLDLHEMMICIVMGDFDAGEGPGGAVMCNWRYGPEQGFVFNNSAQGHNIRFLTAGPYDLMWSRNAPTIPGYHIVTLILSEAENRKEIWYNGEKAALTFRSNPLGPSTIDYEDNTVVIGAMPNKADPYDDDIAELLVYNGVSDELRGQAEAYLSAKYGIAVTPSAPSNPDVPILWLDAAQEVTTSGSDVTDWEDQAGGDNDAHWSEQFSDGAKAQLTSATFPQGTFPVVRFGGDAGYSIDYHSWLRQEEIMVFAVCGPFGPGEGNGAILSNYDNSPESGYNVAQGGDGDVAYFFNGYAPLGHRADMWSTAALSGYNIVTWVYSASKQLKRIYINGIDSTGTADTWVKMDFNGSVAALGSLREFGQWFDNDIAELRVYGMVGYDKRRAVEQELYNKYFADGPLPPTPCGEWGLYDGDLDEDCEVDLADFSEFTLRWMDCTDPSVEGCIDCSDPNDPWCQ